MTLTPHWTDTRFSLTTTAHETYSLRAPNFAAAVELARERGDITGGLNLGGLDLSGTNLTGADLSNSWLDDTRLTGACLIRANLSGCNLTGADLTGADLSGANLSRARLGCATLGHSSLRGADLSHTNLRATGMDHAQLQGARLAWTTLGRSLSAEQLGVADTDVVATDLYERFTADPTLAARLKRALTEGHFMGRARGRLPELVLLGRELGSECGAARHWLEEIDPHIPASDVRVAHILTLIARWTQAQAT